MRNPAGDTANQQFNCPFLHDQASHILHMYHSTAKEAYPASQLSMHGHLPIAISPRTNRLPASRHADVCVSRWFVYRWDRDCGTKYPSPLSMQIISTNSVACSWPPSLTHTYLCLNWMRWISSLGTYVCCMIPSDCMSAARETRSALRCRTWMVCGILLVVF